MQIRRYSKIEPMIFVWFMLPYTVLMNLLLFGYCTLSSTGAFVTRMGISALYFAMISIAR